MAHNEGQEPTERPTQKRLEEARREGQIPRSPDLAAAVVLTAAAAILYWSGGHVAARLGDVLRSALRPPSELLLDPNYLVVGLAQVALASLWVITPLLAATFVVALAAPVTVGGANFSLSALQPKFSRLNPLAGLGRMFSTRALTELIKALLKFALVGTVAAIALDSLSASLMRLGSGPIARDIAQAGRLCAGVLVALVTALALIAAIDVPYQIWRHNRELRMTHQQIREEHKEQEGSPETKGRIRAQQQLLARGRMMQDVPTADVIVTNPTHFAVALRYDDARMRAPTLVAKGADLVAARIRSIGADHNVPLVEAPPLARALFRAVDIGDEVPPTLYVAVAQVLTYVYQLRGARKRGAPPPAPPVLS
jgi:flagellar biosynthetic protein FlhB